MTEAEIKPAVVPDLTKATNPSGASSDESDRLVLPKDRKGSLTVEAIQEAATEYFEKTGKWPTILTKDEVPGMPGDSWEAIDGAARFGRRGLEGGQSLFGILKPLKEQHGSKIRGTPLTVEAVRAAAIKYFEQTGGWPSVATEGEVPGMPGETWRGINQTGRLGCRGLEEGQTLVEILKPLKLQYSSRIRGAPLTVEAVREAALKYFEQTRDWPTRDTRGDVQGMPGETWKAINGAARVGNRGLEGGQSLFGILKPLKEQHGSKIRGTPLTVEAVRAAAIKYFEQTGGWPSVATEGEVPGMPGETWSAINSSGAIGGRGLEKGQTLREILKPLKEQLSINLASTRLPRCFIDPDKEASLSARLSARIGDNNLGALLKGVPSVTFSKGEAFEQLAGLLLLTRYKEERVIPQYCLIVAPDRGYYGLRVDYRAGNIVYEIKWGGATENIQETFEKHSAQVNLSGDLEYKLIMLRDNSEVTVPYSTFGDAVSGTHLEVWLREVQAHLETLVEQEKGEELVALRNYLYGLVMKGNTFTGKERMQFLAEELLDFLCSDNRDQYAQSHRYALYCPLAAHFEHEGTLYAGMITPPALQAEKPEQYKALYSFGRLVFEDPLDRDIAVMCELSGDEGGLSAKSVLRKESGLVENAVFHLPGVGEFTKAEIPDLETLKKYLHFVEGNFEFGLEYIAHFGSRA